MEYVLILLMEDNRFGSKGTLKSFRSHDSESDLRWPTFVCPLIDMGFSVLQSRSLQDTLDHH